MIDWKPEPSDVEWTRQLLETLNDHATWCIPKNQSIWRVDKTAKTLTCIHGKRDSMFEQITLVCAALGYTAPYAPEALTPEQVKKEIEDAKLLGADEFGSGKYVSLDASKPQKKYVCRPLSAVDRAAFQVSLGRLPRQQRWKGKLTPQCDFCASDAPTMIYAASRLTTGEPRDCWRWLACMACHDAITRNDFKAIERRAASALSGAQNAAFAAKAALMAFHADVLEV